MADRDRPLPRPHFRETARRPVDLRVRFRRDQPGAEFEVQGSLVDVGLGGARISCLRPPPVGTRLRVALTPPTAWEPLEVPAEVRWVDGDQQPDFGIAFGALTSKEASALHALLDLPNQLV